MKIKKYYKMEMLSLITDFAKYNWGTILLIIAFLIIILYES